MFQPKNIFSEKIFLDQHFLRTKNLLDNFFWQKFFFIKNFFWQKKPAGLKNSYNQNFFLTKSLFWGTNFFGPKFCFTKRKFWTNIFSMTKIYLESKIFFSDQNWVGWIDSHWKWWEKNAAKRTRQHAMKNFWTHKSIWVRVNKKTSDTYGRCRW